MASFLMPILTPFLTNLLVQTILWCISNRIILFLQYRVLRNLPCFVEKTAERHLVEQYLLLFSLVILDQLSIAHLKRVKSFQDSDSRQGNYSTRISTRASF